MVWQLKIQHGDDGGVMTRTVWERGVHGATRVGWLLCGSAWCGAGAAGAQPSAGAVRAHGWAWVRPGAGAAKASLGPKGSATWHWRAQAAVGQDKGKKKRKEKKERREKEKIKWTGERKMSFGLRKIEKKL